MIDNAKCINCKSLSAFQHVSKNKYKCVKCQQEFHKCSNKECTTMIKFGPYCERCAGNGLKNGGAVVVSTLFVLVTAALREVFKNRKG